MENNLLMNILWENTKVSIYIQQWGVGVQKCED